MSFEPTSINIDGFSMLKSKIVITNKISYFYDPPLAACWLFHETDRERTVPASSEAGERYTGLDMSSEQSVPKAVLNIDAININKMKL